MTLAKYLGQESYRTQRERAQRRKKEVGEVAGGCGGDGGGGENCIPATSDIAGHLFLQT